MNEVDDIWNDMKQSELSDIIKLQQRVANGNKNKRSEKDKKIKALLVGQLGTPQSVQHSTKKLESSKLERPKSKQLLRLGNVEPDRPPINATAQEILIKISRDLNLCSTDKDNERRDGLNSLNRILFLEYCLTQSDYNTVHRDICKTILKRYNDPIEKCRELAYSITRKFFELTTDMVPILPYFIPALMQRLPEGFTYDDEMKVFVHDREAHEAYRRGKAVDRQDKAGAVSGAVVHRIIEPSEEIRLLACQTLHTLVSRICDLGAPTVLHSYFQEIVIYTQAQLRDPHPDLKLQACRTLQCMAEQESFTAGMKFFAVGLAREILPVLRQRPAKVRVAAVAALQACVMVPDYDKRKGAGTEAIQDLVGFREDNVLPVAGFYKADVQINYLAELVCDSTILVRERVAQMLSVFLTALEDKYDHQTRLLPYLLDLLTDDVESISSIAMSCLKTCGQLYEDEHPEDIIEKRQYGVDGDKRINLEKPVPKPFTERPRIGIRLYVRGNTARFLKALMNELTNWTSRTRLKSAQLLRLIIILCEEHLTMEAYTFLPTLVKAVNFANDDKDLALHGLLMDICELTGRYMVPDTFIHYLLPRLRGDVDILASNADSKYRLSVLQCLHQMLDGVKPSLIPNHFVEISAVLTDSFVIDPESVVLRSEALQVVYVLLNSLNIVCRKKGISGVETDYYQTTGRLMTALQHPLRSCFKLLVEMLSHANLRSVASSSITLLAEISTGTVNHGMLCDGRVVTYFIQNVPELLKDVLETFEVDAEGMHTAQFRLLQRLVECPWRVAQSDPTSTERLLLALLDFSRNSSNVRNDENEYLLAVNDMLQHTLISISTLNEEHFLHDGIPVEYSLLVGQIADGTRLTAAVDDAVISQIYRILSSVATQLLEVFVIDSKWGRTPKLQHKRLQLLRILLHGLELRSGAQARIIDEPQLTSSTASVIVTTVIRTSCQPGVIEPVRLLSVEILGEMFDIMAMRCNPGSDGSSLRLMPFKLRSAAVVDDFGSTGISTLLEAIDDSSDAVRLQAVRSLLHALPFVCEDDDDRPGLESDSEGGRHPSPARFSVFIDRIMKQVTAASAAAEEMQTELDYLLRASAVLDPSLFKVIVDRNMRRIRGSPAASDLLEMLSCLIDHSELLDLLR